jgi:hypothetical protein
VLIQQQSKPILILIKYIKINKIYKCFNQFYCPIYMFQLHGPSGGLWINQLHSGHIPTVPMIIVLYIFCTHNKLPSQTTTKTIHTPLHILDVLHPPHSNSYILTYHATYTLVKITHQDTNHTTYTPHRTHITYVYYFKELPDDYRSTNILKDQILKYQ